VAKWSDTSLVLTVTNNYAFSLGLGHAIDIWICETSTCNRRFNVQRVDRDTLSFFCLVKYV